MEALRYSLFAPSATTVMMVFGIANAMSAMIKTRYQCKDDNGKPLLPHPYEPWNVPSDPKYKDVTDKAYRAFKMFENVKEWTFMALPVMWVFAVYGGDLPYVSQSMIDGAILVSGVVYTVATQMYVSGYLESAEKRISGFKLRLKVGQFWLLGSVLSLVSAGLLRFQVIKKDGWMQV
jgi:hypothetical protein